MITDIPVASRPVGRDPGRGAGSEGGAGLPRSARGSSSPAGEERGIASPLLSVRYTRTVALAGGLRIAVVVPAYRCAPQLGDVLRAMPSFVDVVVVVDDASPDAVSEAARSVGDPRVVVLRHETNQGVGGAMATGFAEALRRDADVVVKCDGDGQMDPADIDALVAPLVEGRAEYAKGCRFHHLRDLSRMPPVRLVGNVGLTFLTKLASGYWHVVDPQNGFVAVRADVLRRMRIERVARDYFFENDMLIRLNALEARVADVPFPTRYGDEASSLRPSRVLFSFPPRLLQGFARRVFWRYVFFDVSPVAIFLAAGLALFGFGAAFGAYHWLVNLPLHRVTPAGTVILSAVPLILGFQLLLQALVLDVQGSPRPLPPNGPPKGTAKA